MKTLFFYIFLFLGFIGALFLFLVVVLFFFVDVDLDKGSPFECGFMSFVSLDTFFSLPFFIISLMFLLFDVEIIIMSFPPFFDWGNFVFWFVLLLVLLATCYEWMCGLFIWVFSFL